MNTKRLVLLGFIALLAGIVVGVSITTMTKKQLVEVAQNPVVEQPLMQSASPLVEYFPNDSASIAMLNAALDLLKKRCIHIKNYTAGGETITLHLYRNNHDYREQKYGWDDEILVEIAVPDNADIPAEMAGQTLYYYMGKGKRPGITMNKSQEKLLCNVENDGSGVDAFLPLDDVPFL